MARLYTLPRLGEAMRSGRSWTVSCEYTTENGWVVRDEQGFTIASGNTQSEATNRALDIANGQGYRVIISGPSNVQARIRHHDQNHYGY